MENNFIRNILQLVSKDELSEENAFSLIKEYRAQMQEKESERGEKQQPIAIVGVACRFPQADTKEELWNNLVNGVDGIRQLPAARLKLMGISTDDVEADRYAVGGYLDEIDKFDADFFHILAGEANYMDPQQRLFMQVGYEALEDAGYNEKVIRNTKTGIYVGYSEARYKDLVDSSASVAFVGTYSPVIASRLSYTYGLKGPAVSVATACSSSLVALHLACNALKTGDCDAALVGGVTVSSVLRKAEEGGLGITSREGKSRSFDDDANGTGWGEGCGVVYIKTLDKAIKDKDHIYAVIKGSAINQDGASNGIASPNAIAQSEVIIQAWENAGIDPLNIGYIEAHGTGTKIGDPIEIKGITNAFKRYTEKKQFCGIGSVKSNFGHVDSCCGMAGLIKVIMALKYKKIPPSLHFRTPNSLMNLIGSAVYVNTELTEWRKPQNVPRCAGISSFGLSGTNCHVVLEEYEKEVADEGAHQGYYVFTLSAKTERSLWGQVEKYCRFLSEDCESRLEDICYTLSVRRDQYRYRIAIPVESLSELKRKLDLLKCKRGSGIENEHVYINLAGEYMELDEDIQEAGSLTRIDDSVSADAVARYYAAGGDINWKELYQKGRIISLPTYAWDEKSYWTYPAKPVSHTKNAEVAERTVLPQVEVVCRSGGLPVEMEEKLARIWGKVLGRSTVDVEEDFFVLGGDSLLAMDFVNKVNQELGSKISIADFFASPNVRGICGKINGASCDEGLRKVPEKPYYAISSSQRRQYVLKQFAPNSLGYNMPCAMIVSGNINVAKLREVFQKLVDRHEVLRTGFEIEGNQIVQRIKDKIDFVVSVEETDETDINEIVRSFMKPFDLDKPPLLRAGIYKLKEERFGNKSLFILDMHHIISDGVSMEILITEFMSLYRGCELPELPFQYKDYAEWQAARLKDGALDSQKEYWIKELKEHYSSRAGEFEVLYDFPRPVTMNYNGAEIEFTIAGEEADILRSLSAQNGGTLYMMLLTIYSVMLYAYTGEKNMIIGSLVACRGQPGLDKIIGLFTNYLPLCITVEEKADFMDLFEYIVQKTVAAFENQEYPFDRMVEDMKKERDFSKNPIFRTMLILHNQGIQNTRYCVDDMEFNTFSWKRQSSTLDLKLDVFTKSDGSLNCRFEYSVSLFKRETVEMLASAIKKIISVIVGNPQIKITELPIFSEEEQKMNAGRIVCRNLENRMFSLREYRKKQDLEQGECREAAESEYEESKIELGENEIHDFCRLARENGSTWDTLLLTCYSMLLLQLSQRDEIFIGIIFQGKNLNVPIPLVIQRENARSFDELLRSVESQIEEADEVLPDIFENYGSGKEIFSMYDFLFTFSEIDNAGDSLNGFGTDWNTENLLVGLSAIKNKERLCISILQKKNLREIQLLNQFSYRFDKVLKTLINNKSSRR